MNYPERVKIVEVGPRDGLQSEEQILDLETRIEFINLLTATGLQVIEVGSFVSPKWVPQMENSATVFQRIEKKSQIEYPMLVPNIQGLKDAIEVGVQEIAVFISASETFSQKNINCSISESIERYTEVLEQAKLHRIKVRGYISCVLGCPYEGEVPVENVVRLAEKLHHMGCFEISLGDTIGIGTPNKTENLINKTLEVLPVTSCAVHFHDTYGQALANCLTALSLGIHIFDASVAGLGGCPYAKGAAGNLATEDILFMLEGMEIKTGINLEKLSQASDYICSHLYHLPRSKAALALSQKYSPKNLGND